MRRSPRLTTPTAPRTSRKKRKQVERLPAKSKRPKVSRQDEAEWHSMLDQLKEYRDENGGCCNGVPRGSRLGRWVDFQRTQYRIKKQKQASQLTVRRIAALESLGFQWSDDAAPVAISDGKKFSSSGFGDGSGGAKKKRKSSTCSKNATVPPRCEAKQEATAALPMKRKKKCKSPRCKIAGCDKLRQSNNNGMCRRHYNESMAGGEIAEEADGTRVGQKQGMKSSAADERVAAALLESIEFRWAIQDVDDDHGYEEEEEEDADDFTSDSSFGQVDNMAELLAGLMQEEENDTDVNMEEDEMEEDDDATGLSAATAPALAEEATGGGERGRERDALASVKAPSAAASAPNEKKRKPIIGSKVQDLEFAKPATTTRALLPESSTFTYPGVADPKGEVIDATTMEQRQQKQQQLGSKVQEVESSPPDVADPKGDIIDATMMEQREQKQQRLVAQEGDGTTMAQENLGFQWSSDGAAPVAKSDDWKKRKPLSDRNAVIGTHQSLASKSPRTFSYVVVGTVDIRELTSTDKFAGWEGSVWV